MFASKDIFLTPPSGGYSIARSVRLRKSASAYLNRNPASNGTRTTWTYSTWVKRGQLGAGAIIHAQDSGNTVSTEFNFASDDTIYFREYGGASYTGYLQTTQVFRDPSAWYHLVLVWDSNNGTSGDKIRLYVNGTRITSFSTATYPSSGITTVWNSTNLNRIGFPSTSTMDGYLTEINFIDGQALTPSSFGSTNAITGVWQPAKYTGTYGNNGFYLNFSNNSASTPVGLGQDYSGNTGTTVSGTTVSGTNTIAVASLTGIAVGNNVSGAGIPTGTYVTAASVLTVTISQNATSSNTSVNYVFSGNNWTPNNISVTAGVTYDSMVDSPTVGSLSSNYAVWNVLKSPSTYGTITNGNLTTNANNTYELNAISSISSTTGKFYAEFTVQQANTARPNIGIQAINQYQTYTGANIISSSTTVVWCQDGRVFANGSLVGTFATYTTGDIVCIAVDCDNGAIYYNKNNSAWINSGSPTSGASRTGSLYNWTGGTVDYGFYIDDNYNGNITNANFGQRPFSYTPPTGFVALNTYNLPASTITNGAAYMAATTYTGTGASLTVANTVGSTSFQPDWVWIKRRDGGQSHQLYDVIRGATQALYSNLTLGETLEASGLSAFTSSGFTVISDIGVNTSGGTYVGWNWKAGTSSSITVSQYSSGVPSIASTVNANTTAGFSIVQFTATGVTATIGHGLGVAPQMIIVKDAASAGNWAVWHTSLISTAYYLFMNTTAGQANTSAIWTGSPNSNTFGIGSWHTADRQIAYCFSAVAGYSAFGSYDGNNVADGSFVYLGFRPRFIMIKSTSASTEWVMIDTTRSSYNLSDTSLYANRNYSESTIGTVDDIDILSNGFKLRNNTGFVNSSQTYIYAAFAENPFKNSLAR